VDNINMNLVANASDNTLGLPTCEAWLVRPLDDLSRRLLDSLETSASKKRANGRQNHRTQNLLSKTTVEVEETTND